MRRENREKRSMLCLGDIHINLSGKEITIYDKKISLTKSEYEICEFLASNRGKYFQRREYMNLFVDLMEKVILQQ